MAIFADAIAVAEKIGTHKEKHAALSGFGQDEKRLIVETFNPFRIFGVKKFDRPTSYASVDASYDPFFSLLDQLNDRHLTGNEARRAVTTTLGLYTQKTATYLERVLTKDLKCGADVDTFMKLYPGLEIPQFDLMLCGKIEYTKGPSGELIYNPKKYVWTFPCLGEVKYDGNRLVALCRNGVVEYLSRSGLPSDYCTGLFDEELSAMEKFVGEPIMVDGEALGEGFQATAKSKGSKNDKSGLRFFTFDWMTVKEWEAQSCDREQLDRSSSLELMINKLGLTKVIKSKYRILHNMNEAIEFYTEVIELGLPGQDEGLIVKKANGKYEWNSKKRSTTWAKWKPVLDVDVKIVGVLPGNVGTKNESRAGAFLVEGEDENRNKIKSKCGGFKVNDKKFRKWFQKFCEDNKIDLEAELVGRPYDEVFRTLALQRPELFIGYTAMIECQSLSKAENSETFALRFPQFIQLRNDK